MVIQIFAIDFCKLIFSIYSNLRETENKRIFSTMGLSAVSDFTGFNQLAASSNMAMIYKADVC